MPPIILRFGWIILAAVGGGLAFEVLAINFVFEPGYAPAHPWATLLIPSVGLVPVLAGAIFVVRQRGRVRRAYEKSTGCLCTSCLYDLSGLGEMGVCPECRVKFNVETDRLAWKRANIGR